MSSPISHSLSVWLPNPAFIVQVDPTSGQSIFNSTYLYSTDFDAKFLDYLKVGTATITYNVDFESSEAKAAALAELRAKIDKEAAEYSKRMSVLQAAVNSLLAIEYKA